MPITNNYRAAFSQPLSNYGPSYSNWAISFVQPQFYPYGENTYPFQFYYDLPYRSARYGLPYYQNYAYNYPYWGRYAARQGYYGFNTPFAYWGPRYLRYMYFSPPVPFRY